jgi:hypothetical protein
MNEVRQQLEIDLAAIRKAIAAGQLEDAKRMLTGVSLNAPPGGELSKEIGNLYLELGFPAMAGRYWYLLEDKSDQMLAACREFERSVADNPVLIIEAIGWAYSRSPHITAKLQGLQEKARNLRQDYQYLVKHKRGWRDRITLLGCSFVAFVVFFVFIMGLFFIGKLLTTNGVR